MEIKEFVKNVIAEIESVNSTEKIKFDLGIRVDQEVDKSIIRIVQSDEYGHSNICRISFEININKELECIKENNKVCVVKCETCQAPHVNVFACHNCHERNKKFAKRTEK